MSDKPQVTEAITSKTLADGAALFRQCANVIEIIANQRRETGMKLISVDTPDGPKPVWVPLDHNLRIDEIHLFVAKLRAKADELDKFKIP